MVVLGMNRGKDMAIATSTSNFGTIESGSMQLLRLLQLASPTLPVGAYAYSQGLEHAVDQHWLTDAESTQQWIIGVMQHAMVHVDLPVFSRLYSAQAEQQPDAFDYWNQYLLDDGTLLKIKLVATKILRLDNEFDQEGNPLYFVQSTNVLSVNSPDPLKKRH